MAQTVFLMRNDLKYLYGLMCIVISVLVVGHTASFVTPLTGTWAGDALALFPLERDRGPDQYPENRIRVLILINPDGTVEGRIGNAVMKSCRVRKNRGWLGRLFNFRTDYIIGDGYLDGHIVKTDFVSVKEFTLPFNITDGKIRGTIMWIRKWKYPKPLVRINIARVSGHQA